MCLIRKTLNSKSHQVWFGHLFKHAEVIWATPCQKMLLVRLFDKEKLSFFPGNYPPGVDKASARDVNSLMNEMTSYLVRCYSKVLIEENDHKKRSSVPPLSVALTASRIQTVNYTSLVLQGV